MPKMKTHKGTAKRFKVTKNGKVKHMKQGRSHLRRKKRKVSDLRHPVSSDNKTLKKKVKQVTYESEK